MDIPDLSDQNLSEKEQRILQSAIKIFSEKGFSATTTNEIAKDANVAEGTIFRYFKTKKDILRGILIQAISAFSGNLVMHPIEKILLSSEDKDLRTVLRELFFDRMKLIDNFFPMARVILTEALYHEDVREAIYQNIISKALVTFKVFHKKMLEKGMIREDISPEAIFRNIIGNLFLFIAQRKLFADKFEKSDFEKELDEVIDVIMSGITRRNN